MREDETSAVESTLAAAPVHDEWERQYRTEENERFYGACFDALVDLLQPAPDATILDAGCGIGAHSVRLAERGFMVEAMDFSESIVEAARRNVSEHGFGARIKVTQGNLRAMPYPEGVFDYVLCWGVLMHVPDVETALAELVRVLEPGGRLIVGEDNMRSVQAVAIRSVAKLLGKSHDDRRTPAGFERWRESDAGRLMLREADIGWLVNAFERLGLRLEYRKAGQFSNLYARFSSPALQRAVHKVNALWFKHGFPGAAFGNILILEKPA
jgi:ubiquinone/menaquinone biosynthesis C-methylase UbiE